MYSEAPKPWGSQNQSPLFLFRAIFFPRTTYGLIWAPWHLSLLNEKHRKMRNILQMLMLRSYFSSWKDKLFVSSARWEKKSAWKDLIGYTVRDEKVAARDSLFIHYIRSSKIGKTEGGRPKENWVKKACVCMCDYYH